MNKGRIKCFFPSQGYGYIEDSDGREIYFHSAVIDGGASHGIANGSDVFYEAITTAMGLEALRVQVAP